MAGPADSMRMGVLHVGESPTAELAQLIPFAIGAGACTELHERGTCARRESAHRSID